MTTQFVKASYQEVIDLHTESDTVSVVGIHTPVTATPYHMLKGFFDTFQKYHYDGCSLSLVPAARLPADISQVSYEAGEPPIDPRDLLNPILWHGCHGESLGTVLNQFYSASMGTRATNLVDVENTDSIDVSTLHTNSIGIDAVMESLYYRALTDDTWLKAHPQRGFRKTGLHPMVYDVSTDKQYVPGISGSLSPYLPVGRGAGALLPSGSGALAAASAAGQFGSTGTSTSLAAQNAEGIVSGITSGSTVVESLTGAGGSNQFFTSRLRNLGWLDTRVRLMSYNYNGTTESLDGSNLDRDKVAGLFENAEATQTINYLPRLFMGLILLPPAYRTEQYFRLVINHRFSFRKFRGVSMGGGDMNYGSAANYFDFNTEPSS